MADVVSNEQPFNCGNLRPWTLLLGNHLPVADLTQEERRPPRGVGQIETVERPPPCTNEGEPSYLDGFETRPPTPTRTDHQIQHKTLPATRRN